MSFANKVIIVTGSNRGIGKAIAFELAKQGAWVVLNGRNETRLMAALNEIQGQCPKTIAIPADVSTKEGANKLIEDTYSHFGRIDGLVNNVGLSSRGTIAELSPEVIGQIFESNVYGAIFPTIYALPYLRKTQGSVVFISSLAGIRGLPGLGPYCAAKMALRAFVESIRIEEKKHKVHAGIVLVGKTEIVENKEAIGADGNFVVLKPRKDKKIQSMEQVAKATLKSMRKRKYIITLTPLGKVNLFLQARIPLLVEKLILKNIHKLEEGNQ